MSGRSVPSTAAALLLAALPAQESVKPIAPYSLSGRGTGTEPGQSPTRVFTYHLERLVPVLLDSADVPGAAVALLVHGELVSARGFGVADLGSGAPVTTRTVFNVGSISKPLTAWGVLRLAESGRVDLDRPANRYLKRWQLRSDDFPVEEVTVRRLLSHTAGLSLEAVPEYGPDDDPPSLVQALTDPEHGPRLVAAPGSEYRYSGGGYMVLQLLVEDVTGRDFTEYMRDEVLRPLGMNHSGFTWRDPTREGAATPYDEGEAVPYFRYVGRAAASLNSTAHDLARFAAASLPVTAPETAGAGLLRPQTVALLRTPQPGTEQFGGVIQNGLGFALWSLADGSWSAGHAGQNTGWAAVLWLAPDSGDGLVVLTNASHGRGVWRWILCDWATWVADTRWRGLCTDRPGWMPPAPEPRSADGPPAPRH